jgi:endonuclease/exonuclease/phosphatase family metal-dependent hydrolase
MDRLSMGRPRVWLALAAFAALAAPLPALAQTGSGRAGEDTVRIVVYNIHHGEGMDGRVDLERIAALIRAHDPDLVALQEIDSSTERTGRVDQAEALGRLTGLTPVFGAFMPYQGGQYGMAVLSRWPILESRNLRLPDGDEPRSSVAVRVRTPSGRELRFVGVHFYRTEEERLAQANRLLEHISGDTVPVILAGDFNSTPGSTVMNALSDRFSIIDKGADHFTFPSENAEREIDFVLLSPVARFEVLQHLPLDEPVASDHRPLFARLILRPPQPQPQPKPQP